MLRSRHILTRSPLPNSFFRSLSVVNSNPGTNAHGCPCHGRRRRSRRCPSFANLCTLRSNSEPFTLRSSDRTVRDVKKSPRETRETLNVGLGPALNKVPILAMVRTRTPEARMARVTSKYQVTVPRKIADAYHIRPGHDIDWVPAGAVIRVIPPGKQVVAQDRESQLRLFDQATERLRKRPPGRANGKPRDRGWRREDLNRRGRSR